MAVAKKMTRQDFIKREREAFILRYKSQAVAGLGLIGGPRAREALRKVANDKASPLRGSAEQAIKNLPKE
jgi:hypothetical protein